MPVFLILITLKPRNSFWPNGASCTQDKSLLQEPIEPQAAMKGAGYHT